MERQMLLHSLSPGSEVVVMPEGKASPADALHLGTVEFVGTAVIRLTDGSVYDTWDGSGILTGNYIAPATDAHRVAIERRAKGDRPQAN